jgi:hypothetical protein
VFAAAFVIVAISAVVLAIAQGTRPLPLGLLLVALAGVVVAFAIGAAIGLILAGLDLLIVLAAWRLTPGTPQAADGAAESARA